MRVTKNIISIMLAILIFSNSVYAATNRAVQPRYAYINSVMAGLSIDEIFGIATCVATVTVRDSDSAMLYCLLQRYEDGGWVTIKSWAHTDTITAYVDKQYAVYRGYTYRLKVTGYALDSAGNILETVTQYSTYETL